VACSEDRFSFLVVVVVAVVMVVVVVVVVVVVLVAVTVVAVVVNISTVLSFHTLLPSSIKILELPAIEMALK
jgi:hypothetical protein